MPHRNKQNPFSYNIRTMLAAVLVLFRKVQDMPIDLFSSSSDSVISPAARCFAIVPSDSEELPFVTKAIYVGEAGNVVLRSLSGTDFVTFANVQAGTIIDARVCQIRATGTSAASIVGLA